MADPFKDLAKTMEGRQRKIMQYAVMGIGADLGTITSRMELKLDNFKHPIRDYLVSEHLTFGDTFSKIENSTERVETPSKLSGLSPGDRVVVLLVNDGQDHVVIARVVDK